MNQPGVSERHTVTKSRYKTLDERSGGLRLEEKTK